MQTSGSLFAESIEKAKETKFEMELKKIVNCFLDGHGNYDSNSVSLKIILYNKQYCLLKFISRKE